MRFSKLLCVLFVMFTIPVLFAQSNSDLAEKYIEKGNDCQNSGDYDNAIFYHKKALEIYKQVYGENSLYAADAYYNMGNAYSSKEDYQNSIIYHKKALKIYEQKEGLYHSDTASTYNCIGWDYYGINDYKNALSFFENALNSFKKVFGEYDYNTSYAYSNIGLVYKELYNYDKSLYYYQQALSILQQITDENDIALASIYENIADIYLENGSNSNALDYYEKSLEIRKNTLGEQHFYTTMSYENVGKVYLRKGDYDRALSYFEKSLAIRKKIAPDTIQMTYSRISEVYKAKGDYKNALDYQKKCLAIHEKNLGVKHIYTADDYYNIARIYDDMGDDRNSIIYNEKALSIYINYYGKNSVQVADTYINLGNSYKATWDYLKAFALWENASNIYKNIFGKNHKNTATAYYNMAGIVSQLDSQIAVYYWNKVLEAWKKSEDYRRNIFDTNEMLFLGIKNVESLPDKEYPDMKQWKLAWNISDEFNADFVRKIISFGVDTVEQARLDMASIKSDLLKESLPIYYFGVNFEAKNNNPAKAFEYSEALRSRGFLDQIGLEKALSLDGIKDNERKEIKNLINKIAVARKEIEYQNSLTILERDTQKLSQSEKDLSDAEKALSRLDSTIGKRVPAYSQLRNPQTAKIKDAQKWCGKDKAVIEYVLWNPEILDEAGIARTYNTLEEKNREVYKLHSYCLVITNKKVFAIQLDDEFDFTSAVTKLREGVIPKRAKPTPETKFEDVRNELYAKLIEPVLPYTKGYKQLVIVPDGSLAFLPFDILRKDEDSKMLCDQFAISLSPSVSVSMIADSSKTKGLEMIAFGASWYDKTLSAEEHRKVFDTQDITRGKNRGFILSTVVDDSENVAQDLSVKLNGEEISVSEYFKRKNMHWGDLPGTIIELNTLKNKAVGSKKYNQMIQENASEMQVKILSKDGTLAKYPILHFACHGYFDKDNSNMSSILFSEVSGKLSAVSKEDGYLTIPEASVLNLNADMVCLSACETGLGEIKTGDGMTGLSRAFMVAGSRHVGVSLWQVDDEATAQFMASMYKKIEKKGMTYEQAYQQTKVEFRKSEDYSHPYYWSAFVLYE